MDIVRSRTRVRGLQFQDLVDLVGKQPSPANRLSSYLTEVPRLTSCLPLRPLPEGWLRAVMPYAQQSPKTSLNINKSDRQHQASPEIAVALLLHQCHTHGDPYHLRPVSCTSRPSAYTRDSAMSATGIVLFRWLNMFELSVLFPPPASGQTLEL